MLGVTLLPPSEEHDKANLLLLLKELLSLGNGSLVVCFRCVRAKSQDMQLVALLLVLPVRTLVRVTRVLCVLIYGAFSFSVQPALGLDDLRTLLANVDVATRHPFKTLGNLFYSIII